MYLLMTYDYGVDSMHQDIVDNASSMYFYFRLTFE